MSGGTKRREPDRSPPPADGASDSDGEDESTAANKAPRSGEKKQDRQREALVLLMCHQCQRNDKGRVVKCGKCMRKRYCIPCITKWYPKMSKEEISDACPVCRYNCNCKACLRMEGPLKKWKYGSKRQDEPQHSKYLLQALLPFVKGLSREQMIEKVIEAKVHGLSPSHVHPQQTSCSPEERIFCDNCKTSIFDFHRSCPKCHYDLCLTCCWDLRDGCLKGGQEEVHIQFVDRGFDYLHGKLPRSMMSNKDKCGDLPNKVNDANCESEMYQWIANENGSIPCPSEYFGGCGNSLLELRCLFKENDVAELVKKAETIANGLGLENLFRSLEQQCACYNSDGELDIGNAKLLKAASRANSKDNYLYNPAAKDIPRGGLEHFQRHWVNGEPVIVSGTLDTASGLSWEPMVMWRALRQITHNKHGQLLDVKAINCLDFCEADINIHQFFKGYTAGLFDEELWPSIYKLKDWPPSNKFEERLPRHYLEFVHCLPFLDYTHPENGALNLATKLPSHSIKPEIGPMAYIAYGVPLELGRGDSVTKLNCSMSDSVYILTHTAEAQLQPNHLVAIEKLKQKHHAQDQQEIFGFEVNIDHKRPSCRSCDTPTSDNAYADKETQEGGAIWDIFRRQDVPKLQDYLNKHFREFRHIHCCPVPQVIHPIHDEAFFLNLKHKEKLKEEYGIEPWTFTQKVGDAVFIPAGCPYQFRNIKSCINVALDFVSPENLGECLRLTEEFRVLPHGHKSKEDKLEVKKMALHALCKTVNYLDPNSRIGLNLRRI